ncbi:MAG TPA: YfhO family protein, partial [Flavobacterium sp.]|nr:YfhO family protein [Flavobacterium sp.]
ILFPWFRYAFYGFAGNYYKGALSLFIPFSFLFVALLGLQEILNQKKVHLPGLIISFLLFITLLWIPYEEPEIRISQAAVLKASLFLTIYLALMFVVWSGGLKKYILPFLVAVVCIEAAVLSWPAFNERTAITKNDIRDKKYHFDYSGDAVAYIRETDKDMFFRIDKAFGSFKSGFNDGMVQRYFGTKVYQSHNHKNYIRFLVDMGMINGEQEANTRWVLGVAFNAVLHPLFSIKYILANESTLDKVDKSVYSAIHKTGDVTIFKNKWHLPFGFPLYKYYRFEDFMKMGFNSKALALYEGVVVDDVNVVNKTQLKPAEMMPTDVMRKNAERMLEHAPDDALQMKFFNQKRITGDI